MTKKDLIIYTDGASRGNPGPGGWAAIIFADGQVMEIAGAATKATNNQMELAAVEAVLSDGGALSWKGPVVVHSDSAYVINGLTQWVKGWEHNGWMTRAKTPVENKALWQRLSGCAKEYGTRLRFEKVKGHAGEMYNERCDALAVAYALGEKPHLFSGKEKDYETFLKDSGATVKRTVSKKVKPKKDSRTPYAYVSCAYGIVHTDKTWAACERRVKGVRGAQYKKVFSKEEADALISDYTRTSLL